MFCRGACSFITISITDTSFFFFLIRFHSLAHWSTFHPIYNFQKVTKLNILLFVVGEMIQRTVDMLCSTANLTNRATYKNQALLS